MNIIRAYTGNWFPRTSMHLREYYQYLRSGSSPLEIDPKLLRDLHTKLKPEEITYVGLAEGGRFDQVKARVSAVETTYFEDGLFVAHAPVSSLADDLYHVHSVYDERVLPAIGAIFSIGLPAIAVQDPRFTDRLTILVATQATEVEVADLARSFREEIHLALSSGKYRVYTADTFVLVVTPEPTAAMTEHLVRSLLFFREFDARLTHFLTLHRQVWEEVGKIRNETTVAVRDLPAHRDRLLDFDRDLSVIVARLSQMELYLDERQQEIDEAGYTSTFRALQAYRFGKMRMNTKYLNELWHQMDEYIESTADIIGLVYQENLQKSLDVQQLIFLLGSVAGVLTLGNLSGFTAPIVDRVGREIASIKLEGYNTEDQVTFTAIAVIFTLAIFFGVKFFTSHIQRIRARSIFGERKLIGQGRSKGSSVPRRRLDGQDRSR